MRKKVRILRNYQQTKNNPFWLRHYLYISMVNLIKDYENMQEEYDDILYSSPCNDGMPHQSGTGSPTEAKALKRESLGKRCEAVEQTIIQMIEKYSKIGAERFKPLDAFHSYDYFCCYRCQLNKDAGPTKRTWNRYRSEFVYSVAKKLNLV